MVSSSAREKSPGTPNTPLPAGSDVDLEAENGASLITQACNNEEDTILRCERPSDMISRLSRVCLDSLQRILRNTDQQVLPKRDLNVLRRAINAFILWDDGYGAQSGVLDGKLIRSTQLYSTTLSLLRSLCKSVHCGLTKHISWTPEVAEIVALQTACAALDAETGLILREARQGSPNITNGKCIENGKSEDEWGNNETDDDSDSDDEADFGNVSSGDHDTSIWFTSFVADVLLYTTCLARLGNALESPAPQARPKAGSKSIKIGDDGDRANIGTTREAVCVESSPTAKVDNHGSTLSPNGEVHTSKLARESLIEECGQKKESTPEPCDPMTMESFKTVSGVDAQFRHAPWLDHLRNFSPDVPPYLASHFLPTPTSYTQPPREYMSPLSPELPPSFTVDLFTPSLEHDLTTPNLGDALITPPTSYNSNSISDDETEVKMKRAPSLYEHYGSFGFDSTWNLNGAPIFSDSQALREHLLSSEGDSMRFDRSSHGQESPGIFESVVFLQPRIDAADNVSQAPGKRGRPYELASQQHATYHTGPDSLKRAEEASPINNVSDEQGPKPQPLQKWRRVIRACDECRRKKIKCDRKQPCTHCTVYSYECTYKYQNRDTLFIRDIPSGTNTMELKELFEKERGFKEIHLHLGQPSRLSSVVFDDTSCAAEALYKLSGYMLKHSTGSGIHLSFAKSQLESESNLLDDCLPGPSTSALRATTMPPPGSFARHEAHLLQDML